MKVLALVACLATAIAPAATAQSSNAARYLLNQELAEACDGSARLADGGLFERDFDGDGQLDLLIAHEGIRCGSSGRSLMCGMQVCSVKIWLRRGDLLQLATDMLGGGIAVGSGSRPVITGYAHGGARWSMRWQNGAFR